MEETIQAESLETTNLGIVITNCLNDQMAHGRDDTSCSARVDAAGERKEEAALTRSPQIIPKPTSRT